MRLLVLLWGAAAVAQARDIPFDANLLTVDRFAECKVGDHRVELIHGVVIFHLMDSGAPPVEIVTPSVSVQPYFLGDYRVEVTRSGQSEITPYGAALRIVAPQGAEWISPGEKMVARGPATAPEFRIVSAISRWRRLVDLARLANFGVGIAAGESSDEAPRRGHPQAKSAQESSGKASPVHVSENGGSRSSGGSSRGGGSGSGRSASSGGHAPSGSSHGSASGGGHSSGGSSHGSAGGGGHSSGGSSHGK